MEYHFFLSVVAKEPPGGSAGPPFLYWSVLCFRTERSLLGLYATVALK